MQAPKTDWLEEAQQEIVHYLTPRRIVEELNKYIVGQEKAKRAVAIAVRNRIRRRLLPPEVAEEIAPKNILMIGPTGVGKTEIARRLARLVRSPFLKVEATKYTEVGYVGRDVESMVRDLAEIAVQMVKQEHVQRVQAKARENALDRLTDLLVPALRLDPRASPAERQRQRELHRAERQELRERILRGELDHQWVELDVQEKTPPAFAFLSQMAGMEELETAFRELVPNVFQKTKRQRMRIPEALEYLEREEQEKLIDMDAVTQEAIRRAEQDGIIFIDEIDKIAGRETGHGPDVSREGVQRDLLPIVEGTTVVTRYGPVRTHHILFIAAGAFHVTKPSDLIPELQGRFPIRVELEPLGAAEFVRILKEPENALTKQYQALLATEGVTLEFTDEALEEIAAMAARLNEQLENIGARRLHTVMEKVLEEVTFYADELRGQRVTITREYVQRQLRDIVQNQDLSRYIL